jgi:RNA polymerase sigma-70 factor, ECF subfamily
MPRLYRFCLALCRDRAEADDVLQEGLVRAFLNIESFQGNSELFGWLCGVLRNQFIELRRSASRRRTIFENIVASCSPVFDQLFGGGEVAPSPEEAASLGEESARLLAALRQLPEDFRTVVLLHDIEGMGYDEIAEVTDSPVGTVKSRHARGRARLVEAFKQQPPPGRLPEGSSR